MLSDLKSLVKIFTSVNSTHKNTCLHCHSDCTFHQFHVIINIWVQFHRAGQAHKVAKHKLMKVGPWFTKVIQHF